MLSRPQTARTSTTESSPTPSSSRDCLIPCVRSKSESPVRELRPRQRSPLAATLLKPCPPSSAATPSATGRSSSGRLSFLKRPSTAPPSPLSPSAPFSDSRRSSNNKRNAMVALTLIPHKGNHARYFPHAGYLGLSPVVVAGTIKTALRQDMVPLDAGKVVVRIRCYEAVGQIARQGAGGGIGASAPGGGNDVADIPSCEGSEEDEEVTLVDDAAEAASNTNGLMSAGRNVAVLWETEHVIWEAPKVASPARGEAQWEWAPLGDMAKEFRLVVPTEAITARAKDAPGPAGSMTFKGWRIWWQVEAVVFHRPMGMNGSKIMKSHLLHLPNYSPFAAGSALPSTSAPSSAPSSIPNTPTYQTQLLPTFSHGVHPRLTAMVSTSPSLTAADSHPVSISLLTTMGSPSVGSGSSPLDRTVTIKKVTVSLERTMTVDNASADASPLRRRGKRQQADDAAVSEARRWRSVSPPTQNGASTEGSLASRLADLSNQADRARSVSPVSAFKNRRLPSNSRIETREWNRRSFGAPPGFSASTPPSAGGAGQANNHNRRNSISLGVEAPPTPATTPSPDLTTVSTLQMAEVPGPLGTVGGVDETEAGLMGSKWVREVPLSVPKPRSSYHYATGETCKTRFGSIAFSIVVKVTFKTKLHGTETLEVPALPVDVSTISKAERATASEHLQQMFAASKAASRTTTPASKRSFPPKAAAISAVATAATGDADGDVAMEDVSREDAVDGAATTVLSPPPAVNTLRRPTSGSNVRRRSETSDAIDAPNRRRPRSGNNSLRTGAPSSLVQELYSGMGDGIIDTPNYESTRPRARTHHGGQAPSALYPTSGVAGSPPRKIRAYPNHTRPRSSGSHGSPVSLSSRSFVTMRSDHTDSSHSTLSAASTAGVASTIVPQSATPMQIDLEVTPASPVLPPYPSPPLEDSPAINFGAFTLSPRPPSEAPAPDSAAVARVKMYRNPFDKRGSPAIEAPAIFVEPLPTVSACPLPVPIPVVCVADEKEAKVETTLPTPPGSAGSSSASIPLWEKLSTDSIVDVSASPTGLSPTHSPDLSGQSRKGSNKWSSFFRRGSKVAATVK